MTNPLFDKKPSELLQLMGGKSEKINVIIPDSDTVFEIKKPILTRPTMSKYEFAHAITEFGKYLETLPDVEKYCGKLEFNMIMSGPELAFELLINKKINILIDRLGYEKVSFSELIINPIWISTIKNYFKQRHETEAEEILKPFGFM